jgi:hypothetical protein
VINESNLHSVLKSLYTDEAEAHEFCVKGFIVDIVREGSIIEVQTGSFAKLNKKLTALLPEYRVTLVYPIACEKTLLVYDRKIKNLLYRRKSPKKGQMLDIMDELIYIPKHIAHPNFSLEVLLTREEEIRAADGRGSWRRGGISIIDRRLLEIVERIELNNIGDFMKLLPASLPPSFSNKELSAIMNQPLGKVQKLTYCFKHMGLLQVVGKKGNAQLFEIKAGDR